MRMRLAVVLLDGGARANADSKRSSGACALRARAPSAFVPSAVARLVGDYVVFGCGGGAARAQWWPVRAASNNRWRGP